MIHSINDIRLKNESSFLRQPSDNNTRQAAKNKRQITLTKAFGFAFYGLFLFFKMERNGKIQLALALLAIAFGVSLQITPHEWICVLLCIAAVLSLEMLNSALEKLCDLVCADYNPAIKIIKDVSAGAVLFTAIISVVIATIIFLPKIIALCFPG